MGLPEIVVSTRSGIKIIPPIFFLRKCKFSYIEIYIYDGYILYKVEIIFPQTLQYQCIFSTFV